MQTVYVLVPLFKINSVDHIVIFSHIKVPKAMELLHLDETSHSDSINLHQINTHQYALQLTDFKINQLLSQSQLNQSRLEILQNALKEYQYNNSIAEDFQKNQTILQMQKKLKKYNSIKEENKKLKKLLQVQLENTQKVRQETQKTMKVLREQFDALVIEMGKKDKNSSEYVHGHQSYDSELNPGRQKMNFAVSSTGKHTSIR